MFTGRPEKKVRICGRRGNRFFVYLTRKKVNLWSSSIYQSNILLIGHQSRRKVGQNESSGNYQIIELEIIGR